MGVGPYSIVHDVELVQSPTNNTKPGPDARALAAYFHDFYYNLKPFIYIRSDPGAQIPATTDPNTADIWGNLFSDVAPTALLSVPMLVVVAAWDIDRLHKHTSPNPEPTRYTERSEAAMRSNILKFDQDFRSSGDAAPNPEWQRLKFDDIRKEGEPPILAFDSSTGIKKHTYNSTESGGSYAYEAIQNSQGSGSKGQKFPPKRGYEDDSNEGRKRKKKDQSSRNHSGSPPAKAETFACPFKGGKYPKVIRACDTDFPNLSKVKYVYSDFFLLLGECFNLLISIFWTPGNTSAVPISRIYSVLTKDVGFVLEANSKSIGTKRKDTHLYNHYLQQLSKQLI